MSFQPFVYGLVDPADVGHVRYVGLAMKAKRPYEHVQEARRENSKRSYKVNWIRKVLAEGREPVVLVLETLAEGADRKFVGFVESCYIKSLREIGHKLTNATDGGDGSSGKRTPEFCAAISARQLGTKASNATRRRLSESHKGQRFNLGKVHTQEQNEQHSLAMTGRVQPPEERASRSLSQRKPETVAKKRAALLGRKHSDATREKMRASQQARREAEASCPS